MSRSTGRKTVVLKARDKKELGKILRSSQVELRVYKRARVLKLVSEGYSQTKASVLADVSESTSKRVCLRYREKGLESVYDRPRCGSPKKFTEKQKQRAVAMVCSSPPKGLSRWTIRVIAEELRRRRIVDRKISRETVRLLLQGHKLKPWREKNVVYR